MHPFVWAEIPSLTTWLFGKWCSPNITVVILPKRKDFKEVVKIACHVYITSPSFLHSCVCLTINVLSILGIIWDIKNGIINKICSWFMKRRPDKMVASCPGFGMPLLWLWLWPASVNSSCVTWSKLLHLSEPWLIHPIHDDDNISFPGQLYRLKVYR